jgi:acetyl esterase/lipase
MLYKLRRRGGDAAKLDEAATLMFESKFTEAEAILASVSREFGRQIIDGSYHLTSELLYREEKGITAEQNQRCRLDVYAPATKKPFSTVIWFHGGGLTQGERTIPLSPQVITHFTIRDERGIEETQPIIDDLAPLFHVRKDAPPMLVITGDREKELAGRYEENAYFWRMMKLAGHKQTTLHEFDGFDHGKMPEPAFPLLLKFVEEKSEIAN